MAKVNDVKEPLAQTAMFFAGLILLIPHRIGMSRVNYVIKRYNLPISRAGLLLYKFHNPIEVSLTIGTLFGNIINWSIFEFASNGNGDYGQEKRKFTIRGCMIAFLILMLLSSIYMYLIYITGDDFGYLDLFYFSLILITLFDGAVSAFAFGINGKYASLLAAGIPISGALVSLLHNIYKFFSDSFHWDDFDYHVLRLQLLFNILTMLFTFILWSLDQIFDMVIIENHEKVKNADTGSTATQCYNSSGTTFADFWKALTETGKTNGVKWPVNAADKGKCPHKLGGKSTPWSLFSEQEDSGATKKYHNLYDWSPIGMLAISLGTVYAFYPSIAPYSIIDYQYASVIELWILVISAIPTLVVAILDTFKYGQGPSFKKPGPSGHIDSGLIEMNWFTYWTEGTPASDDDYYLWNLVWLCAIFYILCIQIFMSMLHYPHSLLSSFFNNKYCIGFISVLFNTLRETMQACGFAGAGKQVSTGTGATDLSQINAAERKVNGSIAATNKLITLFVMMFCVFTVVVNAVIKYLEPPLKP